MRSMPRFRRRASRQLPPEEGSTPTNCSSKSGAKLRSLSPPPGRSGLSAASVTSLVPEAELAVITHSGSHANIDRSYGALATYVSEHALAVDPVREYYPVAARDQRSAAWRTDIGWPIFDTRH